MNLKKLKFYADSRSGNCYKLQLLCAQMRIEYDWQEVDIMAGETRTPEYLAMNANGKIPVLALPDGRYLAESNAILCYLADGSEFFSGDAYTRANILQWMFFEQYSHEPPIAGARFTVRYLGNPADRQADLKLKIVAGNKALAVMEHQLTRQQYIATDYFSIADIALYAYTHVAHEGGFDLAPYAAINGWLKRVEGRAGYRKMDGQKDK